MATKILKKQYVDYTGETKLDAQSLFVEVYVGETPKLTMVKLSDLYIKTSERKGVVKTKKVSSYVEFVKHSKNNNVFIDENAMQSIKHGLSKYPTVVCKAIDIPHAYDSTSIDKFKAGPSEKVPYGLKRSLRVKVADATIPKDKVYYAIKNNGKEEFIRADEIYFYDKSNKGNKVFLSEFARDPSILANVTFYTKDGKTIDTIYLEQKYYFSEVIAKEEVDFKKKEKTTYTIKENVDHTGNVTFSTETKTEKIDRYFSEQKFVKQEVQDPKHPGKTKMASLIQFTNYEISNAGEFVKVTIDGYQKMVKLENIVDEDGNAISSLSSMVGKVVKIKDGDEIIATSQPLTYEQATFLYSTRKVYKETSAEPSEQTYLRLASGEYVKESDVAKPIAYKLVALKSDSFDAYLTKTTTAEGKVKYVVVSKDYFDKHGDSTELKRSNSVRIARCDIGDKDCSVVQTTSKGLSVEQCSIVKKIKINGEQVECEDDAKDVASRAVHSDYQNGNYKLDKVYHNGTLKALEKGEKRYEFTDVDYMEDSADNLHQYKALTTKNLKIKNGKIVGGAKFDILEGIKDSFSVWGQAVANGFGVAVLSGFFIPVVGPILASVYGVAALAAIPAIPLVNIGIGIVKNSQRSRFKDKLQHDRKKQMKQSSKELGDLYERMTSKDRVAYTEARFNSEYDRLINKIIALSSATAGSELVIKDGEGVVTPENANAAKEYTKEFNSTASKLNGAKIDLDKAQERFDKLDAKIKMLESEGRMVKDKLRKKYDAAKAELETCSEAHKALLSKHESLKNYQGNPTMVEAEARRDELLQTASVMRAVVYLQKFPESNVSKEVLKDLTDSEKDVLKTMRVQVGKKLVTEMTVEEYNAKHKKQPCTEDMWKNIIGALKQVQESLEPVEEIVPPAEEVEETAPEEIVPSAEDELSQEILEINTQMGVDQFKKDGSIKATIKNVEILMLKMQRLTALLKKDKFSKTEKQEIKNIQKFLDLNQKTIQKILEACTKGEKLRNVKDRAGFLNAYDEMNNALTAAGAVRVA